MNNELFLSGTIIKEPSLHHKIKSEEFLSFVLQSKRLSGVNDEIEILVSSKILFGTDLKIGDIVTVDGQLRTYNTIEEEKKKVYVYAYARNINIIDLDTFKAIRNKNIIKIKGNLCKDPVNRKTNSGRNITDLTVAVNRKTKKSDYIPCIAWGINATYSSKFKVGDLVEIAGRLQSRPKKDRVYYDLSIKDIKIISDKEVNHNGEQQDN